MDHILAVLRNPAERASGFIALGEMAGALDGELVQYLPTITLHLREAVCYCLFFKKNCALITCYCHLNVLTYCMATDCPTKG